MCSETAVTSDAFLNYFFAVVCIFVASSDCDNTEHICFSHKYFDMNMGSILKGYGGMDIWNSGWFES